MRTIWLLRMAKWAHRPPSARQVKMVLGIVALCLVLFAMERIFGWPDWLTPDLGPGGRIRGP